MISLSVSPFGETQPGFREDRFGGRTLRRKRRRTSRTFFVSFALWLGSRDLNYPPRLEHWITEVIVLLFWIQVALWAMEAARYALRLRRQRAGVPDAATSSSTEVVLFVAGIVVWTAAALFALDTLGIEIRPLLAGLGIGGIAIALAVQTVLSDLLASISIALDRPFARLIEDFSHALDHVHRQRHASRRPAAHRGGDQAEVSPTGDQKTS